MQTIERRFLDRTGWPPGEWDDEPDKIQFPDPETGLPCLAVRNHMGAWCGYVGVPEGHPYFQKHYDEADVSVHGGLTFASFCQHGKEDGICHVPGPGEPDRVWWLGFDCNHWNDACPMLRIGGQYKTLTYVKEQIARLAKQLAEKS